MPNLEFKSWLDSNDHNFDSSLRLRLNYYTQKSKKKSKKLTHFYYISFKSCKLGALSFLISNFNSALAIIVSFFIYRILSKLSQLGGPWWKYHHKTVLKILRPMSLEFAAPLKLFEFHWLQKQIHSENPQKTKTAGLKKWTVRTLTVFFNFSWMSLMGN